MTNKYKWKTIIGVIGVWLHNHPNQKKHNIEFHTDELEYIKKALTPPTADEVCKALSEYLKRNVYYEDGMFKVHSDVYGEIVDLNTLPPHLITLIGRFYEGLEKVGKEE